MDAPCFAWNQYRQRLINSFFPVSFKLRSSGTPIPSQLYVGTSTQFDKTIQFQNFQSILWHRGQWMSNPPLYQIPKISKTQACYFPFKRFSLLQYIFCLRQSLDFLLCNYIRKRTKTGATWSVECKQCMITLINLTENLKAISFNAKSVNNLTFFLVHRITLHGC